MARLLAYVRVSTEGQKDNTSLEWQWESIQAYARAMGHEVVWVYREVETASGLKERITLKRALRALREHAAEGLIVAKLDRFARNTLEGLRTLHDLQGIGKAFVAIDANLDTTTPIGKCMMTMLLAFAELEREQIASRIRNGKAKVRSRNGYEAGRPPYGWHRLYGANGKTLVPNYEEQEVIRKIFTLNAQGFTTKAIADELNNLGYRRRRSLKWDHSFVWKMLQGEHRRKLVKWYNDHGRKEAATFEGPEDRRTG